MDRERPRNTTLRIAVVTAKFPYDGKEPFLLAEIAELEKRSADLVIVPATPALREHAYGKLPGTVLDVEPFAPATVFAAVAEFVRAPRVVLDVLYEIVRKPRSWRTKLKNVFIFPKALAVGRRLRARGITHIHAYWLSTPSTIAYVCSRVASAPWSASGHRWDLVDTNLSSEPQANAGFMQDASFIRTISERGRRQVSFALGGRKHPRVRSIHLGVKTPVMGVPAPSPSPARPFALVCIAALVPVKGHTYLLDALARVRDAGIDFRCDLIGEGPLRLEIEEQVTRLGLESNVVLFGRIPLANVHDRLSHGFYDAAILTSINEGNDMCEGIPVSLMEAMSCNIPCVATNSGSVGELVDDRVGRLVPCADPPAIADAIIALAREPEYRRELGRRAAERVREQFSVERTTEELHQLIDAN